MNLEEQTVLFLVAFFPADVTLTEEGAFFFNFELQ
jgi:hypothetical protein